MCSGIFQRFLLHMICLGLEAILKQVNAFSTDLTKPVENAFTYLKVPPSCFDQ